MTHFDTILPLLIFKQRIQMKFFKALTILVLVAVSANGAKVTWGADGKPIIEASSKPVVGCIQGGLEDLGRESNSTTEAPTLHCS